MNASSISLLAKFGIGAFAGICACVGPVIGFGLAEDRGLVDKLLSENFIAVFILTTVIVGIGTAIIFANSLLEAGQIFMRALGLPALLLGGVSVNYTSSNAVNLNKELVNTVKKEATSSGVPVYKDLRVSGETSISPVNRRLIAGRISSVWDKIRLDVVSVAHADALGHKSARQSLAQQIGEDYVVVLGVAGNREQADRLATRWKALVRTATVIRRKSQFFVIDDVRRRFASVALRDAQRIRAQVTRGSSLNINQVGIVRLLR